MGASPVPPKRSEAEPTPLPNPSHPANHRILMFHPTPQTLVSPPKASSARKESAVLHLRELPQSNIHPASFGGHSLRQKQSSPFPSREAAQEFSPQRKLWVSWHIAPAAKRRKKRPNHLLPHQGIKRVTIRKLPPTHQNHPQSSPIHPPTRLNNHSTLHPLTTLVPKNKGGRKAAVKLRTDN